MEEKLEGQNSSEDSLYEQDVTHEVQFEKNIQPAGINLKVHLVRQNEGNNNIF